MHNLFEKIDLFVKLANMTPQTARAILGVSEIATDEEINRAYKRIARLLHTDRNKDPEAKSKLLTFNAARDTLLFPERRDPNFLMKQKIDPIIEVKPEVPSYPSVADLFQKYKQPMDENDDLKIKRKRHQEAIDREKKFEEDRRKKKLGVV